MCSDSSPVYCGGYRCLKQQPIEKYCLSRVNNTELNKTLRIFESMETFSGKRMEKGVKACGRKLKNNDIERKRKSGKKSSESKVKFSSCYCVYRKVIVKWYRIHICYSIV